MTYYTISSAPEASGQPYAPRGGTNAGLPAADTSVEPAAVDALAVALPAEGAFPSVFAWSAGPDGPYCAEVEVDPGAVAAGSDAAGRWPPSLGADRVYSAVVRQSRTTSTA